MCSNDDHHGVTSLLAHEWLVNRTIKIKDIGACKDGSNKHVSLPDVIWPGQNVNYNFTNITVNPNGTFCSVYYKLSSQDDVTCDLIDSALPSCVLTEGNHALTFTIFASLTILCRVPFNNFFSLLDSTAMQYAETFNGSYSMSFIFNSLGCFIASYLAAALIIDPSDDVSKQYKTIVMIVVFLQKFISFRRGLLSKHVLCNGFNFGCLVADYNIQSPS